MRIIALIFLTLLPFMGQAQCLDTLRFPQAPGTACNPEFYPVCGCDGVTYRNSCFAEWATVLQWAEGPCEQVAVNLFPNPVVYQLFAQIATKFETDVQVYIFDRNGNIYYQADLRNIEYETLIIPVYDFDQGLYIFMAQSGQDVVLEKFVKWNE